jgi:hypothetical protein
MRRSQLKRSSRCISLSLFLLNTTSPYFGAFSLFYHLLTRRHHTIAHSFAMTYPTSTLFMIFFSSHTFLLFVDVRTKLQRLLCLDACDGLSCSEWLPPSWAGKLYHLTPLALACLSCLVFLVQRTRLAFPVHQTMLLLRY